ncbi:type II secretion system F family protein [Fictibacillus sp. b24]|uniref:type II secretion system F family protein n=1 Tax=Fictibacillus sp. b24 TaxID=3055863 RepID=UPI0025A071A9|nr:type II secretion system F family protein [Fictibacillus sp. b24]MDM5318219.1 type II secretion system F family protein [Fictibacillus sp. b24]
MNPNTSSLAVLAIAFILLFLLISFIYIWIFIAKKSNLHKALKMEKKKKKQKRSRSGLFMDPLLKAADYAKPTAVKYTFFTNKSQEERLLVLAGSPYGLTHELFHSLRFVLALGLLMYSVLYLLLGLPFGLMGMLFLPLIGYFGPIVWLNLKAKDRQELISAAMPDFLDTVSVTLSAGVGIDQALHQVTKQFDGPLIEEIEQFNREVDLGVPRKTAYMNLLARNKSKELEMLVNSLLQGQTLGVPVSTTFRLQAEDLRAMRGFKAKEKAAKASPQITLITTFFVAPAVFVLIIGLLFLNVVYNPGAFGLDILFD